MAPILGGGFGRARGPLTSYSSYGHDPLFHDQPIPGYNPAPPRNAIWTVMAVFSFFGLCFLVVAGWIKCVEGMEGLHDERRGSLRSSGGRRNGFQEWLGRRRSVFRNGHTSSHIQKTWKRPADTKFWRDHSRPGFEDDFASPLLGKGSSSQRRSSAYNTFSRITSSKTRWYPTDYLSSPEDDVSDDTPSMRGYSPRASPPKLIQPLPRPPIRSKSTDGILAGKILSTRRSEFKRTLSLPGKVSKPQVRGMRRKLSGSDGEDERNTPRRPAKRPARRYAGFGCKQRAAQVGHRGLDVVLEEAGSTPERY